MLPVTVGDSMDRKDPRDRPWRPNTQSKRHAHRGLRKIIYLRQNYHFSPTKIVIYLKRHHDVSISSFCVWRILKQLDLNATDLAALAAEGDLGLVRIVLKRLGEGPRVATRDFIGALASVVANAVDR